MVVSGLLVGGSEWSWRVSMTYGGAVVTDDVLPLEATRVATLNAAQPGGTAHAETPDGTRTETHGATQTATLGETQTATLGETQTATHDAAQTATHDAAQTATHDVAQTATHGGLMVPRDGRAITRRWIASETSGGYARRADLGMTGSRPRP